VEEMIVDIIIVGLLLIFLAALIVILIQARLAGKDLQKELDDIRESRKRGEQ